MNQFNPDDDTRALNEYSRSAQLEATIQFELELAEAKAIAAGVEGKNEPERKAHLRLQLADQHVAVQAAEAGTRDARRDLDVARAALDCLRYHLRLLGAGQGVERHEAPAAQPPHPLPYRRRRVGVGRGSPGSSLSVRPHPSRSGPALPKGHDHRPHCAVPSNM
ncbi:hypothetical protein [Deinococcus sp. QL22]|uniref:hypothetical protein n=1 Tax=Deinococcus sp. QL22 TaxID=2939437 RepID=UPI002016E5F1|nr:hypothetical protein [Deinococcus sp. QL22]UQN09193.1 hypothetical protein M1R55_24475 [Deinococcus sp. QL22]